jgi:hypothetical protein
MKCVICFKNFKGHGNNAHPLAKGKCCDFCNAGVIVARLQEKEKVRADF